MGSSSSVTSSSGVTSGGNSSLQTGFLTMLRVDYNFIDVEYRYGLSQVPRPPTVGPKWAKLNRFGKRVSRSASYGLDLDPAGV
jgi:hypothetical protein